MKSWPWSKHCNFPSFWDILTFCITVWVPTPWQIPQLFIFFIVVYNFSSLFSLHHCISRQVVSLYLYAPPGLCGSLRVRSCWCLLTLLVRFMPRGYVFLFLILINYLPTSCETCHENFFFPFCQVCKQFTDAGFMAEADLDSSCLLNKKIRNAQLAQYNFILGEKIVQKHCTKLLFLGGRQSIQNYNLLDLLKWVYFIDFHRIIFYPCWVCFPLQHCAVWVCLCVYVWCDLTDVKLLCPPVSWQWLERRRRWLTASMCAQGTTKSTESCRWLRYWLDWLCWNNLAVEMQRRSSDHDEDQSRLFLMNTSTTVG